MSSKQANTSGSPSKATMGKNETHYVGDYFYIRNQTGRQISAFVSNYGGSGSDEWFPLTGDYQWWSRKAWELVALKDDSSGDRQGLYLDNRKKTTYITVRSKLNTMGAIEVSVAEAD